MNSIFFLIFAADSDNPVKPAGIAIDETNFPDPVFRNYLIENYDFAEDGILTDEEIKNTTDLEIAWGFELVAQNLAACSTNRRQAL